MKMKDRRSEKILLFVVHLSPKGGKSCKAETIALFFMQKKERHLREKYKENRTL